jgi:hypothetical protein
MIAVSALIVCSDVSVVLLVALSAFLRLSAGGRLRDVFIETCGSETKTIFVNSSLTNLVRNLSYLLNSTIYIRAKLKKTSYQRLGSGSFFTAGL